MSEPKSKKNPTYALDTLLWVKLLNRVWWPGTVVDPLTIPQELLLYVKKVEPIACVVKFKEDDKYHVVGLYEEVYLYSCDRKMEFIEKGFSFIANSELKYKHPINDGDDRLQPSVENQYIPFEFKSEIQDTIKSGKEFVYGDMYDIYVPKNVIGPYPRMEDLMPDVNPVTAACQKAALEKIFLHLSILE